MIIEQDEAQEPLRSEFEEFLNESNPKKIKLSELVEEFCLRLDGQLVNDISKEKPMFESKRYDEIEKEKLRISVLLELEKVQKEQIQRDLEIEKQKTIELQKRISELENYALNGARMMENEYNRKIQGVKRELESAQSQILDEVELRALISEEKELLKILSNHVGISAKKHCPSMSGNACEECSHRTIASLYYKNVVTSMKSSLLNISKEKKFHNIKNYEEYSIDVENKIMEVNEQLATQGLEKFIFGRDEPVPNDFFSEYNEIFTNEFLDL